ncbi:MAG: hypothetical protein Q4C11_01370 [Clostridium sp.]|nr:hypothetical protein [Clostridium sp.]
MKNLKSENGSITSLVIVTVLFFVTILSTSYMVVNALRKSQLKSQINAKDVYERDLKRVDEIVAEIENRKNQVWPEPKEENETINGEVGNAYNPTIPAGYLPVNTYNAKWGIGQTTPTTDAVDHGLVIQDKKGNEWVWIPVDSATLTKMIELSGSEKTLCGASVKTSEYSKAVTIGTNTISRTTPGTSSSGSYREPDMVVGALNGGYDAKKYTEILGSDGTEQKLAQLFVDEYGEMIKSITKYEGFYIGRYEISDAGVQKDQKALLNKNWYTLYNKCKELKANDKVETRMIWGIQWDIACDFIANKGDKKNVADSRYWGNYSDSQGDAAVTVTENGKETKKFGSGQITGYSEYWKANNVYDLAGNYWEWTQEAFYKYYRATRGGVSDKSGSSKSVLSREAISPDNSLLGYISTRPTLIIKP